MSKFNSKILIIIFITLIIINTILIYNSCNRDEIKPKPNILIEYSAASLSAENFEVECTTNSNNKPTMKEEKKRARKVFNNSIKNIVTHLKDELDSLTTDCINGFDEGDVFVFKHKSNTLDEQFEIEFDFKITKVK
ncbi:hypothetical protein DSECCO2_120360 [anaerobic digester metagenome]